MINQQLVDYVKQQLQAGVAKDSVRKALIDAGWAAGDVDDSMKSADPGGGPAGSSSMGQSTINPTVAMGGKPSAIATSSGEKFFSKPAASAAQTVRTDEHPSGKKFVIATIAMGAVILLLAGALAFVYFNLNSQLEAAQGGTGSNAQVASLQQQVNQLNSEKADLTAQTQNLTASNQEVLTELGFFVQTTGTSTAPMTATVKGTLSGNASTTFALTTAHNVRILVANSKDANVAAALTPLVSGTTSVTLTGTHVPASLNFTVTAVNGAAL